MKRNILILFLILFLLLVILPHAAAQENISAVGSPFAAQCSDIRSAEFVNWNRADTSIDERYPLDLDMLLSMQYEPGIWVGYDHPQDEYGRRFIGRGNEWRSKPTLILYESFMAIAGKPIPYGGGHVAINIGTIQTSSSCGELFVGRGYITQQHDVLLILETLPRGEIEATDVCDGAICGRHHVAHFYISLDEWQRVTQYRADWNGKSQ